MQKNILSLSFSTRLDKKKNTGLSCPKMKQSDFLNQYRIMIRVDKLKINLLYMDVCKHNVLLL